ncbi:conserved hypothetical protein [Ricinus communis]|uniref:Uncharacterized protein n=1 Tax=Ricinus communis TaxID=3988 RepID=B9RPW4_RICCO|nr:conserved hypothetical protein [Ricinus communis]
MPSMQFFASEPTVGVLRPVEGAKKRVQDLGGSLSSASSVHPKGMVIRTSLPLHLPSSQCPWASASPRCLDHLWTSSTKSMKDSAHLP